MKIGIPASTHGVVDARLGYPLFLPQCVVPGWRLKRGTAPNYCQKAQAQQLISSQQHHILHVHERPGLCPVDPILALQSANVARKNTV
jgi:hypothetical protein